ncbi:MAG: zinc metallopeptidase [Oscillospiraceae bacterium]|jgi:Zn-dependent membrane protease YugP|nr:zinc metallopeptidase [Oscillospiraceae bacterium]
MSILYILIILVFIFAIFCQINVATTFKKYNKKTSEKGNTAEYVARAILDDNRLYDVKIERVKGHLTDHYDPTTNVVRLSDSVINSTAIGAIGVAAHECGHAIQHNTGYSFIKARTALFPVVNFANGTWFWLFILGMIMNLAGLIDFAIILFSFITLFQLVTLPVELNASSRAIAIIGEEGLVTPEEVPQARKVLTAAAMTYIAALAMSVLQLVRLLLIRRD